jgi:hypothetical protein
MNRLRVILSNRHTSGGALVALLASGVEYLGPVWFPQHAVQLQKTGGWIARAALIYAATMAGDAKSSVDSGAESGKLKTESIKPSA